MFSRDQFWVNNKPITRGLFHEFRFTSNSKYTIFTFADEDNESILSFSKIYRAYCDEDPTEFELAMALGGWDWWQALVSSPDLQPYLEKLRVENMARQKSKALRGIIKEAKVGKSAYAANKFLYDMGFEWETQDAKKKKQIEKEVSKEVNRDVMKDAERLGITVISNDK